MSEKYKPADSIRIVEAVAVDYLNADDNWVWYFLDIREALQKAKELLMKIEPDERLIIGTLYCGHDKKTGKLFELVPSEDDLEIGGVKYCEFKDILVEVHPASFDDLPEGTPEHIFGDCRRGYIISSLMLLRRDILMSTG